MKRFIQMWRPVLVSFIALTLLCGVIYPGVVTLIAQAAFPEQASGSLIEENGRAVGSKLIGQSFTDPKYLLGRPDQDNAPSNLNPMSADEKSLVEKRVAYYHQIDPQNQQPIPMELVTASASGVDPQISVEAAKYQAARIAAERGIEKKTVEKIIDRYTTKRTAGFLGEPVVNVLQVNLALDKLKA
ncbi:potassium-transporting ATPase subunit KdpC [Listeria ilorinensis]|uniref:potassium-transporting ATPase subunit KdpC n=1 Tax=Listeria ilorinensis TaxID=2867439 RepID=UPI001EF6A086|nr:potassium-transporting ATPase subunit KdpC [Listeria ilorinensis]